jgi:hypothetical protein
MQLYISNRNGVTLKGSATRGNEDFPSDDLIDSVTNTDDHFQRRLGLTKAIFRQLCSSAAGADTSFRPKRDATGRLGHAEQKGAAVLRVLVYAEAFDQPDHFLRLSEESIRQSFLKPTQQVTEAYAQTAKLQYRQMRKRRLSASDLRGYVDAFPPEYVRTICDDFWNLPNPDSAERKQDGMAPARRAGALEGGAPS